MNDYIKTVIVYVQNNRILKHIVFWFCIFIVTIPKGFYFGTPLTEILIFNSCFALSYILTSYYFAYWVIPYFFLTKKIFKGVLLVITGFYSASVLFRILNVHVAEPLTRVGEFQQESVLEIILDWKFILFKYFPSIFSIVLVFLFVKYFMNYKQVMERDLLMAKQKVESELKTLKAQLNPHFLFNTLNNIYTLSISNSPDTPDAIGKLAEILDYVLYRCNDKFVSLNKEIQLLHNYIELEKLRYDERLQVSFTYNVEKDYMLPPLLLLSLVENAFKHGAGEDSGSPTIHITTNVLSDCFVFCVDNTVPYGYTMNKENIGLTNIRKQLDLLYGSNYCLDVKLGNKHFYVSLTIKNLTDYGI